MKSIMFSPHWTKETAVPTPVIADATATCGVGVANSRWEIGRRTAGPGLTRVSRGENRGCWRHDGGVRTDATGLVEGDGSGGLQVRTEGGRRVARGDREKKRTEF
jgi:hypothetical protein